MQKRKRSQRDREEKMAKRIAKMQTKRGENRLIQQQQQAGEAVAQPLTEADHDQKYAEAIVPVVEEPVPADWNCSLQDAAKGTFAVLEVIYSRPQRYGIAVAQVCVSFLMVDMKRNTTVCV